MHQPRLLFLDAYDSFSNNIIALLQVQLDATVEVIRIDDKRFATGNDASFHEYLRRFDGVIAGPGPGDPRNPEDLGLIGRLWNAPDDICLPVLGVCLGFQSLALAFGASAEKLREPRHGFITELTHRDTSLFQDAGLVKATQYHSLHVILDELRGAPSVDELWELTKTCPHLEPLAWDLSDDRNGPILMSIKHQSKPFWGVQYHPESICTNTAGATIIRNWWSEALTWSFAQVASKMADPGPLVSASRTFDLDSSDSSSPASEGSSARSSLDYSNGIPTGLTLPTAETTPALTRSSSRIRDLPTARKVTWTSIDLPPQDISVTDLLASLQDVDGTAMMFESGTKGGKPVRSETGRHSIIACLDAKPKSIRYSTMTRQITSSLSGHPRQYPASMEDLWLAMDEHMAANKAIDGPISTPFWGGLTGFITYEAGLETIDVAPGPVKETHPDVWFVFVERSVVVDHVAKKVYIQSLHDHDSDWMQRTERLIGETFHKKNEASLRMPSLLQTPVVTAPVQSEYEDKVRFCQHHIRAGDSYELCLTDQSTVTFSASNQPSAWELYARLRATNPAPFGAYLHFLGHESNDKAQSCAGVTMLSSSPERFLSWSRSGKCQFRPIKGTVLKSTGMTRSKAEALLNSQKEQAENLMIVDLIRHDLHGVVGAGNVKVEKLMQVEEYETVYQLVSVIEGQLPDTAAGTKKGVHVLAASLPPGSMTGAPKKRSCELLTELEGRARGVYSGVLGYMDVGGGGDFSVIIRTGFKWDDESEWRLGAGGAVTSLSTADGEYDEMMAKRVSSLRAFC